MTDETLMLCVKNGDLDKAALLYERHKSKMFRFFLFKSNNDREDSNDCVQQVFYRLIKYRNSFREDGNFLSWLYSIAQNVKIQNFKDKSRIAGENMPEAEMQVYELKNDDHEALHKAIGMLPEPYREVIIMSKIMEMKYLEIAKVCDCSEGLVKVRVFRAMQVLKENYKKIA